MMADRVHFLDAASRIGRRLCRDAVWHEGRCNWLGWAMEPHGGQWISVYRAMGVSVYDGAAGIGLFLAYLARPSDDNVIATTAVGALAQALTAVEDLEQPANTDSTPGCLELRRAALGRERPSDGRILSNGGAPRCSPARKWRRKRSGWTSSTAARA